MESESERNIRPLDYAWVLSIQEQSIACKVHFEFRPCGTHFIKDEISYTLFTRTYAVKQEKQISITIIITSLFCAEIERKKTES